ncbi:MAG: dipeptide epimerase [Pseudomonadota bacterium]
MSVFDLSVAVRTWAMRAPFVIHSRRWDAMAVVETTLSDGAVRGRGEGAPIFYKNETAEELRDAIETNRARIEAGVDAEAVQDLDMPSGARNALDAALWDLRAKRQGIPVWRLADMAPPEPVPALVTISLGSPTAMAEDAAARSAFPVLKLKLGPEDVVASVEAVRRARPDATILVDANCAWDAPLLAEVAPALAELGVAMIEQPLHQDHDADIASVQSPIPLCADESCQSIDDLPGLVGRYQMINIKLDKCGGLTPALALARKAKRLGFDLMVGNMLGSSLAMAPAHILAQACAFADLDGPLSLASDQDAPLSYEGGRVSPPAADLWG